VPALDDVFKVDWRSVFVPELGLLELVLRGTLMYLALFVILRFLGSRQSGKLGAADLLVITLIADAAQNALGATYRSVPEGVVLVVTIVAWDYAIDWLQYHVPVLRPWFEPPPLQLIRNGEMNRKNMRAELITPEELMAQLREQGIERIEDVKQACLETNGSLSVIKRDG
jgi:uncharacterized membrane protein YcaP (DUF421 family)